MHDEAARLRDRAVLLLDIANKLSDSREAARLKHDALSYTLRAEELEGNTFPEENPRRQ